MINEFNILDSPLEGINLIEASAGTGKTWTISMIYLRLVVENELPVEGILVVTFTIPATAELRTRIRQCIKNALDYLEHGRHTDESIAGIIDRNRKRPGIRERLYSALRSFDEASVFTIHSFCQQVLTDNAFESGSPFRTEITTDNRRGEIAVTDYWRRVAYSMPEHAAYVLTSSMDPQSLLKLYKKKPMAPGYLLRPNLTEADPGDVEDAYIKACECYSRLCEVWRSESENVKMIMTGSGSLSGTKYNSRYVLSYLERADKYIRQGDPLLWNDKIEKFTRSAIEAGVNKGKEVPQSPFFDAAQAMKECIDSYNDTVNRFRITVMKKLFDSADSDISMHTVSSGLMGFDDLIRGVYQGLNSSMGESLAQKIRSRYRAALIDEFQDTDSMQFAIFSTMFRRDTALFLIGDPKQAIYRFRGADIFSYMKAAEMADRRYTLARNWRSTPGLIDAVNRVFGECDNPFVFEKIGFNPVKPGKEGQGHDLLCSGKAVSPLLLELVDYEAPDDEHSPDKDRVIAARLTDEITSMLSGDYTIDGKSLLPADIAVLVRSNNQAAIVKSALSAAGIPAVTRSSESVFLSAEATELYYIFSAILNPADQRRFRTALSTVICGYTAGQIALMSAGSGTADGIDHDESASSRFYSYREAWGRGFMDMFIMFMEGEGVASRLFAYPGGGRSMANIIHIAELLADESAVSRLAPADTLARLARYIADPPEGDRYSMRLETDEDAVNVMTMHSSKGLEFPVVFCPYLAAAPAKKENVTVYHEADDNGSTPVLYLDSNLPEDVRLRKQQEDDSETARLIYVALTRAKSHCNVMMKITGDFDKTILAKILFTSRGLVAGTMEGKLEKNNAGRMLELISSGSGGTIGFVQGRGFTGSTVYAKPDASPSALKCREFTGDLSQRWRMYSYSAISAAMHDADDKGDEGGTMPYRPATGVLPPGARSGLCLHEIFENSDFTWESSDLFRAKALASLGKYGFGHEYTDSVTGMVMNVLQSPLDGKGLRLSVISNEERLSELEFHFPVETLAGLHKFLSGDECAGLVHCMEPHGMPSIAGMMKGYIDLVFRHNDRYYIVDWKSNMLELSQGDYSQESLLAEMKKHNYHLQYHIYTVALHRYLSMRLGSGYDYDKHFGGVFYLFIRGMNGTDSSGVFNARPGRELTARLDGIFRGQE